MPWLLTHGVQTKQKPQRNVEKDGDEKDEDVKEEDVYAEP
jgi:hypothetical protein